MTDNLRARVVVRPQLIFAIAAAFASAASAAVWSSRDGTRDFAVSVAQLPWVTVGSLLLLAIVAAVHFSCAAAALRGVVAHRLPWRQSLLVQLAAAATNRVVPTGIGGGAVNARYLSRIGMAPGAIAGALGTLAAVGALTDAAYVAGVTTLAPSIGLGGAANELKSLVARGAAGGQQHGWAVASAAAVAIVVMGVRLRGRLIGSSANMLRHAMSHLIALGRKPRRVGGAAVASMATTAVLGLGFVVAVRTWGTAAHPLTAAALIALYWVASAAGNATPLPSLFGVTEAALVGGLVVAGYSPTSATISVLVFRGVTFWLPLPVGIWATRRLRRAALL